MVKVITIGYLLPLSFFLTWLMIQLAKRQRWLDEPNQRSAHKKSTPTTGGVAIVLAFLLAVFVFWFNQQMPDNLFYALLVGGFVLAIMGFYDDVKTLSVKKRLLVQCLVALWVAGFSLPLTHFEWLGVDWLLSDFWSLVIGALLIVAMINITNFMDGIDGLLASEVVFIALAIALFLWLDGQTVVMFYFLALALVVLGFLLLNFAPAKIFMGDVGSVFLGFTLAVLMLYTIEMAVLSIWSWLILLLCFWLDVLWTLLVRLLRQEAITQAHNCHCYQKITARLTQKKSRTDGHRLTVLWVMAVNVFWLLPLAFAAQHLAIAPPILLLIAIVPVAIVMQRFGAGRV